ncbi:MAG: SagB/ThcOx family dehydrogenase [Sedimentisphaerales bacterium]|jgi:SagB-type dehydrogenase family enzyme|nr:SagB/ThcOx family dehydrogenase [Sedimentisphaerales bacterium]
MIIDMGIGQEFHNATALSSHVLGVRPVKIQPVSDQQVTRLALPTCQQLPGTLDQAIRNRSSVRDFDRRPISPEQLAQLLFAGFGQLGRRHTVPSAGALYPLELYPVANRVQGVDNGIYHYVPTTGGLEPIVHGQVSGDLAMACLGQEFVADAAVVIAICAHFNKTCRKYGDRGYRYVYMEAGHMSQNIYLAATAMGLGSVAIGAFFDRHVNDLFSLDGVNSAVIYLHAIGYLAGQ